MIKGKKNIKPNLKSQVENMKFDFRYAKNPFWSDTNQFKQAICELRKEGIKIIYDRKKDYYYNEETISDIWGYKKQMN